MKRALLAAMLMAQISSGSDDVVIGGLLSLTAYCSVIGAPSMISLKGIYPPATIIMSDADGKEVCRYQSISLAPCDKCPEKGKPVS